MSSKIPFISPSLPSADELVEDYIKIHENNFYSNNGPFYYEFMDKVQQYLGRGIKAVGLANATSGLILALRHLAQSDKRYVIVPSFTFAAGPLSILWSNFEPYFVDIEPETLAPNIGQIEELLKNESIAAILLCNPFGIGLTEIESYELLAARYQVPLIIDSAAGFGSSYNNDEKLGGRGDCEVFSFHVTKPFGISEGGMISSKSKELADQIETLKNFGFNSEREVESIGFNAKITEITCASGLRMLPKLDKRVKQRQEIYCHYVSHFEKYGIKFIANAQHSSLCFASLVIPDYWDKGLMMKECQANDIEVRDYYNPIVHEQRIFKNFPHTEMFYTNYYSQRMVSLPVSENLSQENVDRIVDTISSYAESN